MRRGITEIGHAPPDHETAQRPSRKRQPDPRERCSNQKIIQHGCLLCLRDHDGGHVRGDTKPAPLRLQIQTEPGIPVQPKPRSACPHNTHAH